LRLARGGRPDRIEWGSAAMLAVLFEARLNANG